MPSFEHAPVELRQAPSGEHLLALHDVFENTRDQHAKAKERLQAAEAAILGVHLSDNSENETVFERLGEGEDPAALLEEYRQVEAGMESAALHDEQWLREGEIEGLSSDLKSAGLSPVNESELLTAVVEERGGYTRSSTKVALAEVRRRMTAGESLDEIQSSAQAVIDRRERQRQTLRIVEALARGDQPTGDPALIERVQARVQREGDVNEVLKKARENEERHTVIEKKQAQLVAADRRLAQIHLARANIFVRQKESRDRRDNENLRLARGDLTGV